ncbi:hypothetical protein T11_18030 [Trichinella zimbabwensis]|uniref:CCHC-type domain-containing protein n=1 Tax=Trichinella zimbabwensis TaxID=268475 RepID=A0A0V1HJB5_9BILA|nr:hypothetical protein T11_18030 [Trichinella zimbabwensis]
MANSKECYNGDKSEPATPLSVLRVDHVTFRAPVPFSMGTDASVWLARMEEYLQQNGIPRDRWKSVARSSLSDDVYAQVMQWPLTVNAPFADFAKMFAERYSPIESTLDARAKFVSRRQLPEESLNAYADAIMLLGRKANCDDTLVRDQFFLGLRNAELKRQLYSSRNEPWQQFLSIAREADFANQLFPTDAAHAAVVQATAENERVQPTPSLDEETADSRCATNVVRADTSSDIDRLVEALRRVLTEEIRGPIMPPHQQHTRAYRRPTAVRARESRCYNCGGRGHLSRQCPSVSPSDRANLVARETTSPRHRERAEGAPVYTAPNAADWTFPTGSRARCRFHQAIIDLRTSQRRRHRLPTSTRHRRCSDPYS